MAEMKKNINRYGLLGSKKTTLSAPKAINVFGNEEESDEGDGTDWVKKALKAEGEKNRAKKQTRLNIEKALEEDPTICQYDEVFDDMKRNEESVKRKKKTEVKKAKYIDNLLKTAERRKREQEHRIERMVQKEREAEGAMFADKESFVTSAYRAKLEEFKKMEKEEENMDRLESIGDVTKQQDISGFYRHLFHQTVAADKSPNEDESKETNRSAKKPKKDEKNDADRDDSSTSDNSAVEDPERKKTKVSPSSSKMKKRERQYRRRVEEASESESDREENKADAEKIERLTTEVEKIERKQSESRRPKESPAKDQRSREDPTSVEEKSADAPKKTSEEETSAAQKESKRKADTKAELEDAKKKKISIWEKRTVGPIFEQALQRYYTRKAMRLSGA